MHRRMSIAYVSIWATTGLSSMCAERPTTNSAHAQLHTPTPEPPTLQQRVRLRCCGRGSKSRDTDDTGLPRSVSVGVTGYLKLFI